jgi:putative flippase GtrA
MIPRSLSSEKFRYVINGAVATLVHYLVLRTAIDGFSLGSAGLANLLGSAAGIAASYAGNRHFVYRQIHAPMLTQGAKFLLLYAALALMHGGVMFLWTDRLGLNYQLGFVLTVSIQVVIGYLGNKYLVFVPGHNKA